MSKDDIEALRIPYKASLTAVRAQMHQLVVIGIDPAAEKFITTSSNKTLNKEKAELIKAAKAYLQEQTAIVTGVLIPSFYQTLGVAIQTANTTPRAPRKKASEGIPEDEQVLATSDPGESAAKGKADTRRRPKSARSAKPTRSKR